jgi:excisionase family DNA binding protein
MPPINNSQMPGNEVRMSDLLNIEALADALSRKMMANGMVERPRLMNLDQAAAYLGMTTDAIKSKALMGQMPAVKIDKKWRFDRFDWDRWIEDHKRIA